MSKITRQLFCWPQVDGENKERKRLWSFWYIWIWIYRSKDGNATIQLPLTTRPNSLRATQSLHYRRGDIGDISNTSMSWRQRLPHLWWTYRCSWSRPSPAGRRPSMTQMCWKATSQSPADFTGKKTSQHPSVSVYMLHEFKVREKKLNKYIGKCVFWPSVDLWGTGCVGVLPATSWSPERKLCRWLSPPPSAGPASPARLPPLSLNTETLDFSRGQANVFSLMSHWDQHRYRTSALLGNNKTLIVHRSRR